MKQLLILSLYLLVITSGLWIVILLWSTLSDASGLVTPVQKTATTHFGDIIPATNDSWTMLLTGDVIPARVVNQRMVEKNDFMWPFREVAQIVSDADITLINLEAPLMEKCPVTNTGMSFCGDGRFAASMQTAGIDVANLANNHTLNHGWEGLGETEKLLNSLGIVTTGFTNDNCFYSSSESDRDRTSREAFLENGEGSRLRSNNNLYCSSFVTKEVKGVKLGFLGYNAVGQLIDRELVKEQIQAADQLVDVLIVSVHWGKEYTRTPETDGIAQDDPRELGRLFIDSGADLVAGNHPHWYQGMEFYNDKLIIYAQGNFIFDQEWSQETKEGYLAKFTFKGKELQKDAIEIIPIEIKDWGQATVIQDERAAMIRDFLLAPIQ